MTADTNNPISDAPVYALTEVLDIVDQAAAVRYTEAIAEQVQRRGGPILGMGLTITAVC